MLVNTAIKVLAVVLESFHRALLITADGRDSQLLHLFGGTLGVILLCGEKKKNMLCSVGEKRRGGGFQVVSLRRFVPNQRIIKWYEKSSLGKEESE